MHFYYKAEKISTLIRASWVAQMVKNLPAMRETWVASLGWDDARRRLGNLLQYPCGESHGQRSLVGPSPPGPKELGMPE